MRGCADPPDAPGRHRAALGAFLGGFDTYVLNLALPTLRDAFRVDLAAVGLVACLVSWLREPLR